MLIRTVKADIQRIAIIIKPVRAETKCTQNRIIFEWQEGIQNILPIKQAAIAKRPAKSRRCVIGEYAIKSAGAFINVIRKQKIKRLRGGGGPKRKIKIVYQVLLPVQKRCGIGQPQRLHRTAGDP
ncbi:MAG: hypothetical protein WCS42_25860, partial [Verrucomicrobiota bacterium]